jgi:tetratricopeptide (TPR) repeat protein
MTQIQVLHRVAVIASAVLLVAALGIGRAFAAATPWPDPPNPINQDDQKSQKKKSKKNDKDDKSGALEQQERQLAQEKFMRGYHAAYLTIMAGHYNRRLGNYDESKVWYEKALAADPNHVRTWSYYGMWQMEQGNRLKAQDDLQKVKLLCGNTECTEYRQLKDVIDGRASY